LEALRRLFSRDGCVESFGVGQFAAALRCEAALPGQATRDLAGAIGAEVEIDYGIFIADRRQWLALAVQTDEWNDEFIGTVAAVRLLHALYRIDVLAAFRPALHHGVEGLQLAVPFLVAIHGIVAPAHRGHLACAEFTHLL